MPTLHWIGKDKVVSHHQDVPYRVLEHKYHFDAEKGETSGLPAEASAKAGNKIIHGDNLEALKSLLPEYEGKIKCIYIDPPYNTGNESWVYNDNVNHPKIKKWLGEVVGKDGEDLTRHDKWLCMMYPRLKLLHKLLADDGAIFISIDDNEQANLKLMCDEIFGSNNSIGPIIQNKMNAKNDTVNIQKNHEFVIVYRKKFKLKNGSKVQPTLLFEEHKDRNVFEENGRYYYINDAITTRGEGGILNARPNLGYSVYYNSKTNNKIAVCDYDIDLAKTSNNIKELYNTDKNLIEKGYEVIRPPKVRGQLGCWTWSLEKFNDEQDSIVITGKKGAYAVKKRTFVDPKKVIEENGKKIFRSKTQRNSRSLLDFSTNEGTNLLNSIMGKSNVFDNPKNIKLIEYLISLIQDKNSIILDSFAGSGTTAHAVLNLNKQDGGNRKFILVEMEDYANDITAERVKRVAKGYGTETKKVEGTGGAFDFYELGLPLFDENQNLNEKVGLAKIREYIWFSETRTSFSEPNKEPYFLGKKDESAYYFIYEKDRLTTLDFDALELIKTKGEQYVIYADNCLLPKDFMAKKNIIFKKIPRDITRF
jgi:adenine-specific DNA-methyltransferase